MLTGELLYSKVLKKKEAKAEHAFTVMQKAVPEGLMSRMEAEISDGDSTAQKANRLFAAEGNKWGGSCKTLVCAAHSISRCINEKQKKRGGMNLGLFLTSSSLS